MARTVRVSPYRRKDGTRVPGHVRGLGGISRSPRPNITHGFASRDIKASAKRQGQAVKAARSGKPGPAKRRRLGLKIAERLDSANTSAAPGMQNQNRMALSDREARAGSRARQIAALDKAIGGKRASGKRKTVKRMR